MKKLIAVLAVAVLSGCSALDKVEDRLFGNGQQQAQPTDPRTSSNTTEQFARLAVTITEVRKSAAHLVKIGQLKPDTARQVQTMADLARKGLDAAINLYYSASTNPQNEQEAVRRLSEVEQDMQRAREMMALEAERAYNAKKGASK